MNVDIVKEKIVVECLKNMSFFAARNQVNASIPEIDAAMNWMKTKVHETISPSTNLTKYAQRMTSKNNELITYILGFLREADFNITNFKTDTINQPYPKEVIEMALNSDKFSEEEKESINAESDENLNEVTENKEEVIESNDQEKIELFDL